MPYSKKGGKVKPYPGPTSKMSLKKKRKKPAKRMVK
tara:strand:- start:3807 stop:3914 length:108 start_codon:yes stop_codon:yes gene_type:complete